MKFDDKARASMKDGVLQDVADHQRATGREVHATENETLLVPVFETIERKQAEVKAPPPKLAPATKEPSQVEAKAKAQGWRITRDDDDDEATVKELPPLVAVIKERLTARVRLLLSKTETGPLGQPSWHEQVMACFAMKWRGHSETEYRSKLEAICEASNEVFGDWRKEEVTPIHFDVGRYRGQAN